MVKQLGRVENDLRDQVKQFQTRATNPVCVGIVGLNCATHCVSYEGGRSYPTDGTTRYRHPTQEAPQIEQRLSSALDTKFDELLFLKYRATNEPPYLFEWVDSIGVRLDYGAALVRISEGSPDIKVGRSPGRSDQELCDLGRNRLIHGFFWDLPEQYFLASVDGRLRRPRSGWGACSAAAKSRRKVFNLWLLLDDRWAGDTAQVEPVR